MELVIAVSIELDQPGAVMLMFATAGLLRWVVSQSTPVITSEICPLPLHGNTRTECRETFFATPKVEPPTIPATWVPCPLQSIPFSPSFSCSYTTLAGTQSAC